MKPPELFDKNWPVIETTIGTPHPTDESDNLSNEEYEKRFWAHVRKSGKEVTHIIPDDVKIYSREWYARHGVKCINFKKKLDK